MVDQRIVVPENNMLGNRKDERCGERSETAPFWISKLVSSDDGSTQ
jgi:hypothetical protein